MELEAQYTEATKIFEDVATRLYNLLKQKEEYEAQARTKISQGTSIFELQQSETSLLRFQREIEKQQRTTHLARERMKRKELDLQEMTIEMKKYEKMKERKYEEYLLEEKRMDQQVMDELSIQLFVKR